MLPGRELCICCAGCGLQDARVLAALKNCSDSDADIDAALQCGVKIAPQFFKQGKNRPEAGDGAKGAGMVAALCDAQVGRVPRGQPVAVPLRPERHRRLAHLAEGTAN